MGRLGYAFGTNRRIRSSYGKNGLKHNQLAAILDGLEDVKEKYWGWNDTMEGLATELDAQLRKLEREDEQANSGNVENKGGLQPLRLEMDNLKNRDMKKDAEKTDWTALLKTSLPLSQQTYEKLRHAMAKSHITWKDMSNELKIAYSDYGEPERQRQWEKGLEEGKYRFWE